MKKKNCQHWPGPNNVFPLISPLVSAYVAARGHHVLSSSFAVIL